MIERGTYDLPPPDLSPQRLQRLQDATQRFYFFLKTWYRRSAVNNLDYLDMQAVGKAFMKGFFEPWGDLNNPGGRLKEMLMTHMTEKNPRAALDDVERTLCRKCRHPHFEHNPQHWGNFSKLIDEGGRHSLFYILLDSAMSGQSQLWDPDSLVSAIMRSHEQRLVVCGVLYTTRQLEAMGLTIPLYNRQRTTLTLSLIHI